MSSALKYRPEIDGLRAVSVTLVILFHAGYGLFGGGYIGVDIFFVISGYLITTIICDDIQAERFSILRFYERRARRILPALVAVLLACTVFAWMWMTPWQLASFSKAVMATAGFVSNFLFAAQVDYFAPSAELNPLLHTWSLSVEEQFYLFFPLLMYAIRNWTRRNAGLLIAGISLGSFGVATALALSHRFEAQNFFLLPTRAWELGAGALLSMYGPALKNRMSPAAGGALALAGLVMIAAAAALLTRETPFPGPWALPPVLGAVLVIGFAAPGNLAGRILSLRPFVAIGLVSYSAYLWHQPLFALARIRSMSELQPVETAGLVLLSFVLAYFSWRLIEEPFRRKLFKNVRPGRFVTASLVPLVLLVAMAPALDNQSRYEARFPQEVRQILSFLNYRDTPAYAHQFRKGSCFVSGTGSDGAFDRQACLSLAGDRPNYVVIGDSHAAMLWRAIAEGFPGVNVIQATASGCKPLVGTSGARRCVEMREHVFQQLLAADKVKGVILAGRWLPADLAPLRATVDELTRRGLQVIVLGPTVEYQTDFPEILAMGVFSGHPESVSIHMVDGKSDISRHLGERLQGSGAQYLPVIPKLCSGERDCLRFSTKGDPMQFDYGHLTLSGASDLVRLLAQDAGNPLVLR